MESIELAAPNSQVLLADESLRRFPVLLEGPITARKNGVLIGTLMWQDGPTRFEFEQGPDSVVDSTMEVVFDGVIEFPTRVLVLTDVNWQVRWKAPLPWTRARVRIWTNSPIEPDVIRIQTGEP